MAVIAIDLGTTSCRAAVFDGATMLGHASGACSYWSPEDGWAEQDAEAVWDVVDQTVQQAMAGCGTVPSIAAISVSVHGDAIIPVDTSGRALHPAILGMDTRSAAEAEEFEEHFGRGQLYATTGMPCEPLNSITKIAWVVRNRPDVHSKTWKYAHYQEFLLMKIAGVPAIDYSMASRTMAFDPVGRAWFAAVLSFAGVETWQMGNLAPSGSPVGIILNKVADRWGISRRALVVTGGHNQCLAAIGAGVIDPEAACYSMGAAEVISTCLTERPYGPAMLESNYPVYCHAVPDRYFSITLNQSGGLSLQWFGQTVGAGVSELLGDIRIEPSPVMFLPHIVGSGTPYCNEASRGAFLGLSLKTARSEMFQAVADALAFEARLNLDTLGALGLPVHELRAVGEGSTSRRMLEIKATVLNRPIQTLRCPEAALLGAAILAQVAVGQFRDIAHACAECVHVDGTVDPLQSAVDPYAAAYTKYRQMYLTLLPFYRNWKSTCRAAVLV
jgi:xylulokinase